LKERGRLYISIDAGTRSTYARVKGIDFFDKIRGNLMKYSKAVGFSPYEIKYIFIPEVNDSIADVDGFVALCESVCANHVLISYDFYAPYPNKATILAIRRLIKKLDAAELPYTIISDVVKRALMV
jgi:molybdenum cofactor biosynthesis enzyme MoaA